MLRLLTQRLLSLGMLAVIAAVVSCGSSDTPQASRSESERRGELRIASLSPGVTVTLQALGLGDTIVARHGWDTAADASLPVAGDQSGLDYEALMRASPTHVFLQWGTRPMPDRLMRIGSERAWIVESFGSLTWDDVSRMEATLAGLAGAGTARMSAIEPTAAQRERLASIGPLLLLMPGIEPAALGPGSFHYQLAAEQLGATMAGAPSGESGGAFTLEGPYVRLHAEDVLRLAPGAIVLFVPRGRDEPPTDAFDKEAIRARLGRLAELGLPAVEAGRVAILDHPHALLAGSSLVEIRAEMASILDAFADRAADGSASTSSTEADGGG